MEQEKIPTEYTGVKGLVKSIFADTAIATVDSNNNYIVPFPGGVDYVKVTELCNGSVKTNSGSTNTTGGGSVAASSIASGRVSAYLTVGDLIAIDGINGRISFGIPATGIVGDNSYMYMDSTGIFGYYGDDTAPWFMVASSDMEYGGQSYHGGDFFVGNYSTAYLWWKYGSQTLEIAGDILISGDIVSSNFTYDPGTGALTGYKLEYSTGNAYFGGAIVSGSSTIGTLGITANAIGSAINSSGNLIKDVVNTNLSTLSKQILGDFTFGSSGAIKMITDVNNGLWLSPTGILGKKAGVTTFGIGIDGSPTFRGEITGGSININNSWHVDSSGNMWWGGFSDYASATYKISSSGVANLSGLVVGTNVGIGSAQDAAGVTTIVGNTVTTSFVNALSVTAGSVAAENITGTYITGKTIRTASSGQRVIIDGANNYIQFFHASGTSCGTIYGGVYGGSAAAIMITGLTVFDALTIFDSSITANYDIDISGTCWISSSGDLDCNGPADFNTYVGIHGWLYMNNQPIKNVANPTDGQDAANKQWVEANFTPL